ncbi:MAG TPA: helix-turn-helix domain-containing protein [Aquihabitans sp.]|jgi:AcrR family transcriptional regulator|nr:helix-turn-helix domain-containing protein [Aquihabitans sp.]
MISDGAPGTTPRRSQARTRLARAAVVDAARTLFVERGYGATTIEAISDRADVPAATVYRLFSSKRGILKALLDTSIVGDQDAVPLAARPAVQALLADDDPRAKLEGLVAIATDVNSRVAPIYRVLVSAAGSDPDAAALLDELTGQRQQGQRSVARALARSGALRPELGERDAADLVHALVSPEVYQLLVLDRRWKPERYQRWLTATLADQLLPRPAPGP